MYFPKSIGTKCSFPFSSTFSPGVYLLLLKLYPSYCEIANADIGKVLWKGLQNYSSKRMLLDSTNGRVNYLLDKINKLNSL